MVASGTGPGYQTDEQEQEVRKEIFDQLSEQNCETFKLTVPVLSNTDLTTRD
jgi:hypothetical protein